jgi:hypothetical protein
MFRGRPKLVLAAALATAASFATPRAARADEGAEAAPPIPGCRPVVPHDRWYGWQIWIADAAVATVAAPITRIDGLGGRAVFFAVFALDGPIVHLVHHRLGTAALSLFVRAWVPMLFVSTEDQYGGKTLKQLPGAVLEDVVVGPVDSFYVGGRVLGGSLSFEGAREVAAILGLVTATAVDGLALANEPRAKTAEPAAPLAWLPMPLAVPGLWHGAAPAVGVGLHGSF